MTNKIKDILKTHKYLLLSFFLPVLLLEGIAIAEKIQPFGSESFLIVDALHQYLPFFADYQEKLKSMDSMFYSFHAGLGYNFLGLCVLSGKSTKSGDRTCVEINAYDDIKSFVCLKDRTVLLHSCILF